MRVVQALLIFSSLRASAEPVDIQTKAQQYMQDQATNSGFSGSVLVGQNGKVLFSRGYGLANAEWNIPNTPHTKFRTGSIDEAVHRRCDLVAARAAKTARA